MALVVFLRGINVGGRRRFRPAALARQLRNLDVVNIGAAGSLVIRRRVSRTALRAELARRLPFQAEIAICDGRDITRVISRNPFEHEGAATDVVRFVSVLSRRPRRAPLLPVRLPPSGKWLLKVIGLDGRFVLGMYRRDMKVIGHLGTLDRLFGVPATTRNWTTLEAVARVLDAR